MHRKKIQAVPLNSSMVAWVFEEMPSRLNTFKIVRKNIFRSSAKERCSTYHTSSLNFSSQLMAFLPFTCAHPVIPGLTRCLFRCSALYRGRYEIRRGLGPIRLISPFRTLISCGISSREVFLIKLPSGVIRSWSGNRFPSASFLSFMVLNFTIPKIFPSFPGLFWKKKGLPLLENNNNMVIPIRIGETKTRARMENERSRKRFNKRYKSSLLRG